MRLTAAAFAAALLVTATGPAAAVEPPRESPGTPQGPFSPDVLERDFRTLLGWFEGEFDNGEQVYFAKELGYPQAAVPQRIHSIFAPMAAPALGAHVFYVQQYSDNDPARIYRQRIYSFTVDKAANALRLDILTPKNAAALVDAHLKPGSLAALTKADVEVTPGCEVFWRRQANQFIGYMMPGGCRVESKRSGKTLVITDRLVLTPDEIWIDDQARDTKGGYVFGNTAGIASKLKRAQAWTCWMAVPR